MQIHAVPVLNDNYVWLIEGEQRQCAVVDLGDAPPVLAAIDALGLSVQAILLTHHHADHTQGIAAFRARYPVPVYGPATEAQRWVTHPLADGDAINLPQIGAFAAWLTPGHTLGHLSYITDGAAFTGDTLFSAGCGRLFEGTAAMMLASLDRMATLPDTTQIYCGHEYTADNLRFAQFAEPENTAIAERIRAVAEAAALGQPSVPVGLAEERQTNPFLRIRTPLLRQAIEVFAGKKISDVEAFGALRRWKDEFDGLSPL
ncbi:MAG TPA: hydroxyacylglutathione hydrolase [Halothiobacillus sp.]|nr:hydroxyacylglutathione hydrolase [Halothiobacillus sp.]